jgi:murein DD-endopeptidase MepM/ murein hydrolase activator NlpD
MANEFYTLIVVPHAKARFRRLQVSVKLTRWVLWSAAGLAALLVGMLIHYTIIGLEVAELKRLRTENLALVAKAQAYEENAARLQTRLLSLQTVVNKLGVMAGLDKSLPENPVSAGVGGVPSYEARPPAPDLTLSLQSMESTATDLTSRSGKLEAFYRDQSALLASTPSVWPVRGYVSSRFGARTDPFTGQGDFHPGLDISTPHGTRVHAPADGVVVYTAIRGGYGNAIEIDHGYGLVTRYGHLSGFGVKPGQRVRRGEVIGFVGSTGKSNGPHLHYEVWTRDKARNPIEFILDEYRSFG